MLIESIIQFAIDKIIVVSNKQIPYYQERKFFIRELLCLAQNKHLIYVEPTTEDSNRLKLVKFLSLFSHLNSSSKVFHRRECQED